MLLLARLIGFVIVVAGIVYFISPPLVKKCLTFWQEGKRVYIGGIIRIVFGVILLLASPQCRLFKVVVVLGLLFLVAGTLIFVLKLEKIKAMLKWWEERSDLFYRLWTLLAIAIGALLLFSI